MLKIISLDTGSMKRHAEHLTESPKTHNCWLMENALGMRCWVLKNYHEILFIYLFLLFYKYIS